MNNSLQISLVPLNCSRNKRPIKLDVLFYYLATYLSNNTSVFLTCWRL